MEPDYKGAFEYAFMVIYRLAHLNGTKVIDSGTLGHLVPEIRKTVGELYGAETHGQVLAEKRGRDDAKPGIGPNTRERQRMGG